MFEYPNYVFSIFSFLGFVLVVIPFPWHLKAWNTGTCLYMAWTGVSCLNLFVNSVVWNGNAINWAPIWCDISSRIIIGSNVGIPISSLCIFRRLYYIARCRSVTFTKKETRRAVCVDLAIGLAIPLVAIALEYIVQGHRFNIFEDVGCFAAIYLSWPAFLLVSAWPIAIGLVSAVYGSLTILIFWKRRKQVQELFSANNGSLNANRYLRLMCLAGIEIIFTIPLASYFLYRNTLSARPYISWANTHWGFHAVHLVPSLLWHSSSASAIPLESTRWSPVLCAFVFFAFFGFADESRKHYRLAFFKVAKYLGYTIPTRAKGSWSTSRGGPPVFMRKNESNRGSLSLTTTDVGGVSDNYKLPIYSPPDSSPSSASPCSFLNPSDPSSPQAPPLAQPEPTLDITSPIRQAPNSSPT